MEEPPIHEHVAMRTLLCAVDRTEKSVPVMKWAAQFACDSGATLRLVHAVSGVEGWPERQLDREFEEAIRTEARNEISALQDAAKVHAPLCIAVGDVASAVRDEARRHNADLLLIGRGVIHENLGRLRTHAHGIIRQAPCPVISV
jgi:nucleotide-binding universal stress UspA family protein